MLFFVRMIINAAVDGSILLSLSAMLMTAVLAFCFQSYACSLLHEH